MKIYFFKPVERRETDSPTNTTNELFFDLIFAACISTLNYDLANDGSSMLGPRIFHFSLLFQPFWWSYYSNGIIYINRFTTEDYLHHAFMLAQALLSIGMATNVVVCNNGTACVNVIASVHDYQSFLNFCLYTGFLQVAIALQYLVSGGGVHPYVICNTDAVIADATTKVYTTSMGVLTMLGGRGVVTTQTTPGC